ncbi:MAG TPA: UDP-3-O-(3-hydroxymyristoyl)glucosamine N-acyltransferase [Gemmatimonadaceae bacterium]|nr:UDP-3-O-(3-hydroxymyristoyl)glucosamine N-acyltransferase [Gemmatimonadaceae bacterium]
MTGTQRQHDRGGEGERVSLTADAIAGITGGTLHGDGTRCVHAVASLERATADDVSFLAGTRYAAQFAASRAGVVLVPPDLEEGAPGPGCRIVVRDPYAAVLALLPILHPIRTEDGRGVHPTAILGERVTLGADVTVGAYATVGDDVVLGDGTRVGPHCTLEPGVRTGTGCRLVSHVTLYSGSVLGERVILHAGVRVGSDGFGYIFRDGAHRKVPHVGRCVIEDDVEIGANSTIDRGSIDDTVIGAGTKIDNLVHIAHNVRIGRGCLIMAQVGIAGSARIEDGCIIAGQAGLSGHNAIGRGARIAAQAGVISDIPAGEAWSGYPARPHREMLRAQAALLKLPDLVRTVEQLVRERAASAREEPRE